MRSYRILLADDHAMFRDGVKKIFENDPSLELAGEVNDGLEVMEFLKNSVPDLVILDISMPNLDGLQALKKIKAAYPGLKVLILTMHRSKGQMLLAFSLGADGYLLKGNTLSDLIGAITTIRHGGNFVSTLMSNQIIEIFYENQHKLEETKLSQRELTVLQLLSQGEKAKQIAERLSVSIATIRYDHASLKKKLNIETTAGLIKAAMKRGLVSEAY